MCCMDAWKALGYGACVDIQESSGHDKVGVTMAMLGLISSFILLNLILSTMLSFQLIIQDQQIILWIANAW